MEQYQPLFLKYRPQSLADLVGQRYVALTLANAIKHDRISHAYLFTGPRGTGKTSSARILAKSLNCEKGPTAQPCQTCTACLEIKEGRSTAVMEIDAASNNSVDDARVLIERAPLVAAGGRFKLYIIDECHMLTKEAFNALLKTIEEPPPNVIFILATTEEHKVPPTIHSRCQRLMFRLINQTEMFAHLQRVAKQEEISIDNEALEAIARHSGGGLRDALGLLDQASLLSSIDHSVTVEDLLLLVGALPEDVLLSLSKSIIAGDGHKTLALANQLLSDGKEAHLIAGELARHLLNLAKATCFKQANKQSQVDLTAFVKGSAQYISALIELSEGRDRAELAAMIEALDRLEQTCKRSSQPALNLEIGLLSLCHRLDLNNLKAIESRITRLEAQFSESELEVLAKPVKKIAPVENRAPLAAIPAQSMTVPAALPAQNIPDVGSAPTQKSEQAELSAPAPVDNEPVVGAIAELVEQNEHAPQDEEKLPGNSSDIDLDTFWSDLLEELQKRHLPTFSLVSTHAFPVSLVATELTIGVLVDNFQKMIENKIDHLQAASTAVAGKALRVKVKIIDQSSSGQPSKNRKNRDNKSDNKEQEVLKRSAVLTESAEQSSPPSEALPVTTMNATVAKKKSEVSHGQGLSHMIGDAYRLFEGPGSRLITANQ